MAQSMRVQPENEMEPGDMPLGEAEPDVCEKGKDSLNAGKRIPLAIALAFAVFCVALDNTIVATAIPRITDQFHAIGDVAVFGKLYSFLPTKWTFMVALAIFEIGSIVCGAAPNATALIVGRAVSGIGAGGLFSGSLIIIAITVPLDVRPVYIGCISSMFGLASIVGPILGGAFTDKVTWRLCFYINLPLGLITALGVLFFFQTQSHNRNQSLPLKEKLKQLDVVGIILFIPAVICLLIALQWGGSAYAWSNARIIALFVVSGILSIAFVLEQLFIGDAALIPTKLLTTTRTVPFSLVWAFFLGGTFFTFVYFLPTWFQGIKGVTAVQSGVRTLAFLLAQVIGTLIAGVGVKKIGYYTPFMWASLILACVGSGLMTTFKVDTPSREWIGYQIIYGLGIGFGMQQAVVAVQAVVPHELVAIGSALVMFCQLLGGSIFVSVSESIFNNKFITMLEEDVADVNAKAILSAGATDLRKDVPMQYLSSVLGDYNDCLVETFRIGLILACLMTFGVIGVEWRSIKA
ncbi:MFS toxin efflux pump [Aspergillus sclerotialis]|uniref:MFS toxin efflux pump n=1 Tax=Aspergillus sclerotialis TaxID=2070753 RepID=A0A3A2ZST9_9EURO|nr:MFS toxin efflux pump [Aspergillus sclerotialis]